MAGQVTVLKAQLETLRQQVDTLRPTATGTPPTDVEVRGLSQAITELDKRQKRLEDAIARDPAPALELPLLRRDMDNLKEAQAQSLESMRQSINQILDLNKWLLGGGALSVLALAVSTLLGRWKGGEA